MGNLFPQTPSSPSVEARPKEYGGEEGEGDTYLEGPSILMAP